MERFLRHLLFTLLAPENDHLLGSLSKPQGPLPTTTRPFPLSPFSLSPHPLQNQNQKSGIEALEFLSIFISTSMVKINKFILSLAVSIIAVIASWNPSAVTANSEGDALYSLRRSLFDPDNVLQSWDPNLVNPCTWFHVTCNQDNHVTRVYVTPPFQFLSSLLVLVSYLFVNFELILSFLAREKKMVGWHK